MVGLRERKKERTRRRIIEVAAARIAARDFDETTMEWIAAEADISVGTLYNYFGSKTVLLLAVLSEDTDHLATRITAVLDDPGHDPVAAARRISALTGSVKVAGFCGTVRGMPDTSLVILFIIAP